MTTCFYYEDDQGRIVDEQGNDTMNWDDEITPFHLKTLIRGINERTAQKWAKKLKEGKDWSIFEKQTNLVNRPKPQLDASVKKSTIHNFLKIECNLSFKELTTQLASRNSPTKIQDRKGWVIK
ncbi:MAG: hypothetical protein EXX96DRAFT_654825 [Benjaminiella poitrasii]|nr:MAG: hypothetical protein EXX96DRAFT_654825 [Benjaminiella poitrasii]